MSKKMLKRSLALGALMAFVITGSALAADITTQEQANKINNKSGAITVDGSIIATNSTENIVINGIANDTILNLNDGGLIINRTDVERIISVDNLKELNINAYTENDINSAYKTNAIVGIGCGDDSWSHKGKILIGSKVGTVTVNSNDLGIWAGSEACLIKIESDNLIVNAAGYGIATNNRATIQIGTDEKKLEKVIVNAALNGSTGVGIYASGSVSHVNILAKDIKVNAYTGLMPRQGDIMLGAANNEAENINIIAKYKGIDARYGNLAELYGKNITIDSKTDAALSADVSGGGDINVAASEKLYIKGNIKNLATSSDRNTFEFNINKEIDDAVVTIDGNLLTNNKGKINLNLGSQASSFNGSVTDNSKGVFLNLNKGTWNVTGASTLNSLGSKNGVISFTADADVHIESADGTVVLTETGKTADDLNTVEQLTKVANKLDVTEEASKTLSAKVVMAEGAVKGETTGIVTFADTDNDQYLNGQVLSDPVEKINTTNASINNMLNVALMAWRAENNDMNKRLGELRDANGEHGVWVRMVNGESEYKDVENEYKTYQLGYDEKLSVDPSWTVGAAVSYTEGDTDAAKASGENKHKGFSIYGSKLNDDGSFVDLIAKVARIEHDFNVAGDKGDWSSNGYSLSAEYGKRLEQGNGLWIEPQVELTYGKISSAECELAGRTVTLEDMESLVGRVGFSLGKDIKQGNVYARASYLYDFEGETTTKFSDGKDTRSFEQDLGGGWWEVGVGANINLSKATYIYADVEKTFGGEVDTNWQWNLGVRYSF